ncbi:hypothetical protein ACVGW6_04280, partial [Enterobacter intestinihominis]
NRVMILERSDEKTPFELGVCAQKNGLHDAGIAAVRNLLPKHKTRVAVGLPRNLKT